jgi:hypothetical protein
MSKKIIVTLMALMLALSGAAIAAELKGTVKEVKGKTVTIEIDKGKASDLSEGDKVEIESDGKKKAPKKGGGMLMGC